MTVSARRRFPLAALLAFLASAVVAQGHADTPTTRPVTQHTNRLADSSSPYLQQHAHNPVDWHPWGAEALEKAKALDKPIFLSIGYAACHWCHVMERESFENPAIAERMNEWFVCIKVDREERPDLDEIYMAATQAMTGQGGWPMSVFLTPQLEPFFAGTYFPPQDGQGMLGFGTLLRRLHVAWDTRRSEIVETGGKVTAHLRSSLAPTLAPDDLGVERFGCNDRAERRALRQCPRRVCTGTSLRAQVPACQ